jgi:biopolymer transport protein ExbB/TolQ
VSVVTGAGVILVLLLLGVLGAGVTVWMVLRVWKARKQIPLGAKVLASAAAAAAMYGAAGTVLGLVMAFGAVGGQSVDPSQKARILAEGISEAMNCAAFSFLVWLPTIIAAFAITRAPKETPGRE